MEVCIKAVELTNSNVENKLHLLSLSLLVATTKLVATNLDPTFCNRETKQVLLNTSEVLSKELPQSAPGIIDVKHRVCSTGRTCS